MNTIYIIKETDKLQRKALVDMPFLAEKNLIRVQKSMFEENSFIYFFPDKDKKAKPEKFFLVKDNLKKEDSTFYYFKFPFKKEQFEYADKG